MAGKGNCSHSQERGSVTVYDEGHLRGMWRLGRIEDLIVGADEKIRRVCVRTMSKKGHSKVLRRPIQHIYPLEVHSDPLDDEPPNKEAHNSNLELDEFDELEPDEGESSATDS